VRPLPIAERAAGAWREAAAICDDDVACNQAIGEQGVAALAPLIERAQRERRPLQLLTHCNAGAIATVGYGTALAPIYRLHERKVPVHVWVGETRPRNQGASLTAWELGRAGVPHTVVADNSGGLLMMQGRVDAVIVGCDRVAANGDVANKIGTYLKALAAHEHSVPFYVACPISSIDASTAAGRDIPIEDRSARELTHITGRSHSGAILEVQIVPDGSAAANPAFDITPATLVSALITEHGICDASSAAIRALCPELFV
jgi:methylthioribose-1-phosphate isomerase